MALERCTAATACAKKHAIDKMGEAAWPAIYEGGFTWVPRHQGGRGSAGLGIGVEVDSVPATARGRRSLTSGCS